MNPLLQFWVNLYGRCGAAFEQQFGVNSPVQPVHAPVEVRAGCPAGGADFRNQVAFFHGCARFDQDLAQVQEAGRQTLTVIQDTVDLIRVHEPDFKPSEIPLDDPRTFELLNRGETCGVFQLESGGMVNLCKQFDVRSIDDIIALIHCVSRKPDLPPSLGSEDPTCQVGSWKPRLRQNIPS